MKPSLLLPLGVVLLLAADGQAGQRVPATAQALYTAAAAREKALRAAIEKGGASLQEYRTAVGAYNAVVLRHPTSGFVDDALWMGARIAREAFEHYHQERDRATARRMLTLLISDYPTSRLVANAREELSRLDAAAAQTDSPSMPPGSPPPANAPPAAGGTSSPGAAAAAPRPPPLPPPVRGPVSVARQLGLGASKIVIDPGHGGHDPGALGVGVSEAEIVLDVALRLEALLASAGVETVLTRRCDSYLTLDQRTEVATRERADLFLSIHVNASRVRTARGVESYFLNFASDPGAQAVAARENASTNFTMNNLPEILRAIALSSKRDESRRFAAVVQRALVAQLTPANRSLRDHGVKRAPFMVLIGADMPSVLVEVGFITHAQESRLLRTESYRQRIAQALFDAIRSYQTSLKAAAIVPGR